MGRPIKFDIVIDDNGDAIIRLPEGAAQQRDAGAISSFTTKLAKLMGFIKERHVGKDVNGIHIHADGTQHEQHHT